MILYDEYKRFPFDDTNKISLDVIINFEEKEKIYNAFEKCMSEFSFILKDKYLSDFNLNTGSEYLLDPYKQFSNVLFKTISLSRIITLNEDTIIDCYSDELDFYDEEFNINRFANIYALIAQDINNITINNLGNSDIKIQSINETATNNYILKVANLNFKIFFSKIKQKFKIDTNRKNKTNIFLMKENELIKEIRPYIDKDFNSIDIYNVMYKKYNNSNTNIKVDRKFIESKFDDTVSDFLKTHNLNNDFIFAFKNIIINMIVFKIEKLINTKNDLDILSKELITQYSSNLLFTNGLFGTFGLAINNSMKNNGVRIVSVEHGLTTGLCNWRKSTINYYEPRTSDYILTYNKSALKTYKTSNNKKLICVECGAPAETKKIKNLFIQRLISRRKLKVKGVTVFYASLNLMTNNNGFFPGYSPDTVRYELEKSMLSNILPTINKEVIYKYYPSQNYLYDVNPYITLAEKSTNIKLADEEDFRYVRTAADIVITSNPSSTLGWSIGLNKPLVYLDSKIYNKLEDDDVRKAFEESFFVFNYDEDNFENNLSNFLNKPYAEIMKLWNDKEVYRKKYDEEYFLGNEKDAGKIGVEFLKGLMDG